MIKKFALLAKTNLVRALALSLSLSIGTAAVYIGFVEPVVSHAATTAAVTVYLNVTTGVSITADAGTQTMAPALSITNNSAVATSTFTVITNDTNGYNLSLISSTAPAMTSTTTTFKFPDYATSGTSVFSVGANTSVFGFSAYGTDVNTTTWGATTICNGTAGNTINPTLKFFGFYTSTNATSSAVASRASTTTPTGVATTVCYAAAQGTSYFVPGGSYQAVVTGTVTAL